MTQEEIKIHIGKASYEGDGKIVNDRGSRIAQVLFIDDKGLIKTRLESNDQLSQFITDAINEKLAAAGQVNWIKCSERLPEESNWYLVFDGRKCFEGFLDTGLPEPIWLDHNGDLPEEAVITHWQPLPDLPTEKGEAG